MAKKVCANCGKEYKKFEEPWYECAGCGAYHCPDCLKTQMKVSEEYIQKKNAEKEREIEEVAREKDIETYKELICPNCQENLGPMV